MTLKLAGMRPMVIVAVGEVDSSTSQRLTAVIASLIEDGFHRLVIDLDGVEFIDSAGIGALVGGLKRARRRGGSLAVVCNRPWTLKVLRISGVTRALGVHTNLTSLGEAPQST
jgi:anti-sigma B factor antagonist